MGVRVRWLVVGGGSVLYAAALAMPTYRSIVNSSDPPIYPGLAAFLIGLRFLIRWEPTDAWFWVLSAAWLANPAIWISLIAAACGRWRTAGIAAGCGLALCLQVLPWFGAIVAGYPGYWTWCGTAALVVGASLWLGIIGEGSSSPHFKITKSNDHLSLYWRTGERSPNCFCESNKKRHFFRADTWRHILSICRIRPCK